MKKIFSKTAYTLIELLVSILLVSVVVLGISSINMVLTNNQQDYGQRFLVKSETQATLNNILNDAALAIGSGLPDSFGNADLGILIGAGNPPGVGDANTFCIHQAGHCMEFCVMDNWACYTWYPSSDLTYPNQIVYCSFGYTAATGNPSFRGAYPCALVNGPNVIRSAGTAYANPVVNFSATTGFSITIQNCLNNTASSCKSTGTSTDPINNPEVQVSGSVFPPQEGTG